MANTFFETLGSCPVPGETPAGMDARYEPEYAAVLEEVEKLSFSGQGERVSWTVIEKNAVAILSEKSKDLQIAAYLGVALWQNRGLEGMLDGVRVLTGLLEVFWETGWPALKRMRGRVNAIDWWHERTYGFLRDAAQGASLSAEQQGALVQAVTRLDELVSSLMPDAAPLRDLTAVLNRLSVSPQEEPAAPPPAAQETLPEDPVLPVLPAPEPVQAAEDPPGDDPGALRRLFVAAGQKYLAAARRAEPDNPSLWQLSRLIAWGGIAGLPASENGQTLLPVPDMNALASARQKLQAGNALEAALEAEDFFATAPFCLDAQEIVHAALVALGPRYAEAARRVREESAVFFSRLSGVEKLSFTDGTPFASQQTGIWLREAAAPAASASPEPRGSGEDPCAAAFASARELMAQSRLADALDALDAAKTASPALNLRLRAYQARLLREAGKIDAAQALAEVVLEETTARDLDNWDPALALEALAAAREAFLPDASRYGQELRDVRRRIARLRPAALD